MGAIPAHSLLVGLVSVYCDRLSGLPALSHVWQHVKLSDVSLGTRPQYSLVADEDDKKPNNETRNYLSVERNKNSGYNY